MKGRIILPGLLTIVILLAILTCFGCNRTICPEITRTSTTSTYTKDSTFWLDYWLKNLGDSLYLKGMADCQNGKAQMPEIETESNGSTVKTKIKDGIVETTVVNKPDSEKVKVPIRVIVISKSQYSCKVYVKYIEKPLKWWQKAGLWGFLILFVLVSVYIVVKWAINKNQTIRTLIGKLK